MGWHKLWRETPGEKWESCYGRNLDVGLWLKLNCLGQDWKILISSHSYANHPWWEWASHKRPNSLTPNSITPDSLTPNSLTSKSLTPDFLTPDPWPLTPDPWLLSLQQNSMDKWPSSTLNQKGIANFLSRSNCVKCHFTLHIQVELDNQLSA